MITNSKEAVKSSKIGCYPTIESLYATMPRSVREHCERVSEYAYILYEYMYDNNKEYIKEIADDEFYNNSKTAFLLHDIGRAYIPVKVLNKAGGLTTAEFKMIKRHTILAKDAFDSIFFKNYTPEMDNKIIDIGLYHHERWDGNGYPRGLKKDDIPIGARICAVADTFDGIASWKPYRKPIAIEEVCKTIEEQSELQFDPVIIEAFKKCKDKFIIENYEIETNHE